MDFDTAFDRLLGHEGGFSDDPQDPGNWTGGKQGVGTLKGTKYGVSAASFPAEDISNLTVDRARAIYKAQFWGPAGCEAMPPVVRYPLFDYAVNSGVKRAIRAVQRAVGEVEDGIIGPRTLQAVNSMDPVRLAARLHGHRLEMLTEAKLWPAYSRGWCKRIAAELIAT